MAFKAPQKGEERKPKTSSSGNFVKIGGIVVLVIVVIAFIFVPMGGGSASYLSNNGQNINFGSYDGQSISLSPGSYMALQVRDLSERLRQNGVTDDSNQFYQYQIYRGAFERSALRVAAIDTVKKAGASVSEEFLDKKVAESPEFQENGNFSADKYHNASLSEKLSVRNQIRDETLYQDYISDLVSVGPSSKEVAFAQEMGKNQRTIEYAAYPLSKYPDAEVETWGKAHPDLFRNVSLSRVTIATSEDEAKKLLKNIQGKATTFEAVAKASSKDAYAAKGGVMGSKLFYEVASDFSSKADAEKLAGLKVGELSAVFKLADGTWAFYRCDAAITQADFSQGVVVAAVRNYLTNRERSVIEDWAIAQAKQLSASGADFEKEAKKAGLTVKTEGPFALNYGDASFSAYGQSIPLFKSLPSEGDLAGASSSEKFLQTAFSLQPNAVSEPFVLGDSVLVLKGKDNPPAKVTKTKDGKAEVQDDTAPIAAYYPYFFQSGASTELRDLVIKSPLVKDDFSKVFFKYIQPQQTSSKG